MLTAAAVACSHSLDDILSVSNRVLSIAVRLGGQIDRRASAIAGPPGFSSVVVSQDPEGMQRKLDEFNQTQVIGT